METVICIKTIAIWCILCKYNIYEILCYYKSEKKTL